MQNYYSQTPQQQKDMTDFMRPRRLESQENERPISQNGCA